MTPSKNEDALRGIVAIAALFVLVIAHGVLAVSIGRSRAGWWRGVVAFVVPPLAVFWGWNAKKRLAVWFWLAALTAYVVGLVIAKS